MQDADAAPHHVGGREAGVALEGWIDATHQARAIEHGKGIVRLQEQRLAELVLAALLPFVRQVMPAAADSDDLALRPPKRETADPDRPRTARGRELVVETLRAAAALDFQDFLLQMKGRPKRQQAVQRHLASLLRAIALAQPLARGRVGVNPVTLRIEGLPGIRRLLEQTLLQRTQQLDGGVLPLHQHNVPASRVRHGLQPGSNVRLRCRPDTQTQSFEPAHLFGQGQPQGLEQAAAVCTAQAVEQAVGQHWHGQRLGHLQPMARLCIGTQDAAGTTEQKRRQRHGLEQQSIQVTHAGLPAWTLVGVGSLLLQDLERITLGRVHFSSRSNSRACSKSNCRMAASSGAWRAPKAERSSGACCCHKLTASTSFCSSSAHSCWHSAGQSAGIAASMAAGTPVTAAGATGGAANQARELEQLTRRQRQLLELIARGRTSAQIADELNISTPTAVSHRRDLMRKLQLHNAADVTRFAIRHGLVRGE